MDKQNGVHPYRGTLLSSEKAGAILTPATAWLELEDIVPSDVGGHKSHTACIIPRIRGP